MAEIEFQRRGRPLWLFVLVLLVVVGAVYFGWASCATLRSRQSLAPQGAPAVESAPAPASASPARP